jgi:hypothetical protein
LGPFAEWNPDIALRYLPIVKVVKAAGLADQVTDIGSGSIGIAPYLKRPITGVDTDLGPSVHPLLHPVNSSVLSTPFEDRSRPCVISVDMLEHLPPDIRQQAVDELVRIAGKLLVLAVPSGPAAEEHDRATAKAFRQARGAEFRYLTEHVANGLPTPEQLRAYVESSVERLGRKGEVELLPNANLKMRAFITRRWVRRAAVDKVAWVALTWLSPLLARVNWGTTYRQIAVLRLHDA